MSTRIGNNDRVRNGLVITTACLALLRLAAAGNENEIIVTATPIPGPADGMGQTVRVIDRAALDRVGAESLPGSLEETSLVSVQERGGHGIQSDLSIRGSTFQQVLVTVDGLPVSDPQTAHFSTDLPFPASALDRVTVIPGPGSAWFGPSAFGGTVDLSLREPDENGMKVLAAYGDFATFRSEAVVDGRRGANAATFAVAYSESDGFQEGTDYTLSSGWGSGWFNGRNSRLRLSAGYTEKDFGARDFYVSYPSHERTSVAMVDLAPEITFGDGWLLKGIARYRAHDDEFILVRDNPALYRNTHEKEGRTERLVLTSPEGSLGCTAAGIQREDMVLDSSNLGDRSAFVNSVFVQYRVGVDGRWLLDTGLRSDYHSRWNGELSPSAAVSVPLGDGCRWRAAGARGIRPPSFTELYYEDPVNIGSADLEPEEAWGGETGLDLDLPGGVQASVVCFIRATRDVIDWVRKSDEEPWQAANIGDADFTGAELLLGSQDRLVSWSVAYRFTDVETDAGGLVSKYALNTAKHDVLLTAGLPPTRGFSGGLTVRYRDVETLDRTWLVGARAAQAIGRCTVFARVRNLLDESYEEIPGVPTAGRYAEAGIEVEL